MKRIAFIMLIILAISGCKKDVQLVITGSVTFDFLTGPGNYYIILDDDQDVNNGIKARVNQTSGVIVTQMDFVIKTDEVPDGKYYLRGGYDAESADDMDPNNPDVWEGQGWYGSNSPVAPATPNLTNLTGNYNFVVYAVVR